MLCPCIKLRALRLVGAWIPDIALAPNLVSTITLPSLTSLNIVSKTKSYVTLWSYALYNLVYFTRVLKQ
jgi:hypothetical protein